MIGLGLSDEKDISVKGFETIKKCGISFLESYTSLLQCPRERLEEFLGVKLHPASREMVEDGEEILRQATDQEVAFLVVGDVFSATTHIDLALRARKRGIKVNVIHNASIISSIGIVGLEVYKYGKVTSIPFHHKHVKTPITVYRTNDNCGLHTLFLLDLDPVDSKFLSIPEAIGYLIANGISAKTLGVSCARIGGSDFLIRTGTLDDLRQGEYGKPPYCLVIPSKMHFMEEEALEQWKR